MAKTEEKKTTKVAAKKLTATKKKTVTKTEVKKTAKVENKVAEQKATEQKVNLSNLSEAVEAKTVKEAIESEELKVKIDELGRSYGTGRRKESSARVWIKKGSGKFIVNKKEIKDYFKRAVLRMIINQPFLATNNDNKFDVYCTVKGGGLSGQADAVKLGISRALDCFNPVDYHKTLRKEGFLTRDSRVVERKKYGKRKARRSFQFSKR